MEDGCFVIFPVKNDQLARVRITECHNTITLGNLPIELQIRIRLNKRIRILFIVELLHELPFGKKKPKNFSINLLSLCQKSVLSTGKSTYNPSM